MLENAKKQAVLVFVIVIIVAIAYSAFYTIKSGTVGIVATFG